MCERNEEPAHDSELFNFTAQNTLLHPHLFLYKFILFSSFLPHKQKGKTLFRFVTLTDIIVQETAKWYSSCWNLRDVMHSLHEEAMKCPMKLSQSQGIALDVLPCPQSRKRSRKAWCFHITFQITDNTLKTESDVFLTALSSFYSSQERHLKVFLHICFGGISQIFTNLTDFSRS